MTLPQTYNYFFFVGVAILPFDYLLSQSFGPVQVGMSYIFLSIASLLFIINKILHFTVIRISILRALILLSLIFFIMLPSLLYDINSRFFIILWSHFIILFGIYMFEKLSHKTQKKLFMTTFNILIFAILLDILDEALSPVSAILETIDNSGIYHSGNRLRAFFDEASVLATFTFSMLLFHHRFDSENAFTMKTIILIFSMITTMSSLIVVFLIYYFYIYRLNPIKIFIFILFSLSFVFIFYDLSFIKYSFYSKILSYITLSGSLGADSGLIRGMYLFYTPAFIIDNPFGIGFGQSVGLGADLVHSYGAPTLLLDILKPNSAVLNGWAQLFVETGVFVGICIIVYFYSRIRKYNRQNFFITASTLALMFLVLAPIYSPPYILIFCCLLTKRHSGVL